ncbi:MAG TPA: anti-sigma factor [Natronosporangium sp.]
MNEAHTLAGAYALNAVDDIERARFRRHLDQCETCALEVAELTETAARMADLTWDEPPPGMKDAVLARIAQTAQARPGRPERAGRARAAGASGWRRWTMTAVAASVLAAAVGGTVYAVQEQRIEREQDRLAQVEAIINAPDASVRSEPIGDTGTVTVIGSRQRDEAVVMLDGLPEPGADRAYELWLGVGDELTSAGVLAADVGDGTAVITGYGEADAIGVSREPAGGSPTGAPTEVVALIAVD